MSGLGYLVVPEPLPDEAVEDEAAPPAAEVVVDAAEELLPASDLLSDLELSDLLSLLALPLPESDFDSELDSDLVSDLELE
jgi:hypothetical protein